MVISEPDKAPTESEIEAAKVAELERFRHENHGDSRTVHLDVTEIVTASGRSPEFGKQRPASPPAQPEAPSNVSRVEASPPEPPAPQPPTPKEYIRVMVEPATEDGYPGRIAEGRYWIEHDYV